jgi:manganese transport protein
VLGSSTDDLEAKEDADRLANYVHQLQQKNLKVVGKLGHRNRNAEIIRMVKESNADLLVIGSHGHTGFKDVWFGETINVVRHEVKVPVLIVNI